MCWEYPSPLVSCRWFHVQLEEESLQDNFVIAYELLDEASQLSFPSQGVGSGS